MEFTVQVKVSKASLPCSLEQGGPFQSTNGTHNGVSVATLPPSNARGQEPKRGMYLLQVRMRSRLTARGVRILLDPGRADSDSMKIAIMALSAVPLAYNRHSWAVLGDMPGLNGDSEEGHRALGRFCAEHFIDRLVCVGSLAFHIASGAIRSGLRPEHVQAYRTNAQVIHSLRSAVLPGDVMLLKGAHSMNAQEILEGLCAS